MTEEKIGGYEARGSSRSKRRIAARMKYEEKWSAADAKFNPENTRALEFILSSINVSELKNVFLESLRRSGVPTENANFAGIENPLARPISAAAYNPSMNKLFIATIGDDFQKIKDSIVKNESVPEDSLMHMQLIYIHEMCHALGRNRSTMKDTGNQKTIAFEESGYEVSEFVSRKSMRPETRGKIIKSKTLFGAFNEGVTQRLAEEIFMEYSRRVGKQRAASQFLSSHIINSKKKVWPYYAYSNQIDSMCERIADFIEVPKDVVWNSFKRGYFEKPQLFAEETIELFTRTFGERFLTEYSEFKGGETSDDAMKNLGSFDKKYSIPDPDEYAEKWLQHLGISEA